MKIPSILILIFSTILLFGSCVSNKPIGREQAYSNQRVKVSNAKFDRKINALGVGTMVGMSVLGGYVGSKSNLISTYENGNKESISSANIALGTLTGFGISYLINLGLKGKGIKRIDSKKDQRKWARKKKGGNYVILDSRNNSNFTIINKKARKIFVFKTNQDFTDFENAFGNSNSYFGKAIVRSTSHLSRNQLFDIYKKNNPSFDGNTKREIKNALFEKSNTLSSLIQFSRTFPEWKTKAASKALQACSSVRDCKLFVDYFSKSYDQGRDKAFLLSTNLDQCLHFAKAFPEWENKIADKGFRYCIRVKDFIRFSDTFSSWRERARGKALEVSENVDDCGAFVKAFPEWRSQGKLKAYKYCKNILSYITFSKYFPEEKDIAGRGAFQLSRSISDYSKVARAFPAFSNKARTSAYQLCNSVNSCSNFSSEFPSWKYKAKNKALGYVNNLSTMESYASTFYGIYSFKNITDKELLARANSFRYESEKFKLAKSLNISNQRISYNNKKNHFYYIPPNSVAVFTFQDVSYGKFNLSVKDSKSRRVYPEIFLPLNIDNVPLVNEPFYGNIFTIGSSSNGRVIEIGINNKSYSSRLKYSIHFVKDPFTSSERAGQIIIDELIDGASGMLTEADYGKYLAINILLAESMTDYFRRITLDIIFEYAENQANSDYATSLLLGEFKNFLSEITKNLK